MIDCSVTVVGCVAFDYSSRLPRKSDSVVASYEFSSGSQASFWTWGCVRHEVSGLVVTKFIVVYRFSLYTETANSKYIIKPSKTLNWKNLYGSGFLNSRCRGVDLFFQARRALQVSSLKQVRTDSYYRWDIYTWMYNADIAELSVSIIYQRQTFFLTEPFNCTNLCKLKACGDSSSYRKLKRWFALYNYL